MYSFKVYIFNFSVLFSRWKSKFLNTYLNTCVIQGQVLKYESKNIYCIKLNKVTFHF